MRVWTQCFRRSVFISAVFFLAIAAGCSTKVVVPERILGSPAQYVENGLKHLEKGRLDAAHREFRMAIGIDPGHAPAHRGEALVYAIRLDFESAFDACHRAIRHTRREDIKGPSFFAHNRFDSLRWDRRAWKRALVEGEGPCITRLFVADFLNEYYKMGLAFKFGKDSRPHDDALERAIVHAELFCETALFHLATGHTLRKMMLETELGRGLTLLDLLSRADAAAFLVGELGLEDRLGDAKTVPGGADEGHPTPADLREHPSRDDILLLLSLGVQGFNLFEDGSFRPESPMRRGDYAVAVIDGISRLDLDESILQKAGRLYPPEDDSIALTESHAIAICVELGIMEAVESGLKPESPLSGMEAAQSIDRIKELLDLNM